MDGPGAKTIPILRTKITLPRPHPETTPRRSLEARLVSALGGKLVLVSAPAGYGKTTLLTRVLGDADIPVAWLSLDENDDQPQRFWSNVISALQAVLPGSCGQAQALLGTPQPPPFELVLVELVNDLVYSGQELILVLDDLHEICSAEILGNLAALIEKMPPNLHLILSSRQTPTLQLARLRARRELAEFTAADLRFQPPEIERLFNELFTLDLSAGDLDTLENLTEGWI
ncbi:MAG TPA: AAA family ATPase, partial [Anaerolineales bacterium]|nr:AAA family ATPase [Anaerolineales bacterium]